MVYLWEREGAGTTETAHRPTSILQPNGSDPSGSGSGFGTGTGTGTGPGLAPAVMAGGGASRSSPAYYPPREVRSTPASVGSGANVRPLRVLEAHGSGAVFDVRWCAGGMVSAGEDGAVGVWDVDEEENNEEGEGGA
jgi:COMPASS component SWD3